MVNRFLIVMALALLGVASYYALDRGMVKWPLALRQGVAALTRRTWATRQRAQPLLAHLEWWRAYYHFVRPHRSLRVALAQPIARRGQRTRRFRPRTPAMAAGLTDRPWTVRELLLLPLPAAAPGRG